jgi:hypothetical protein
MDRKSVHGVASVRLLAAGGGRCEKAMFRGKGTDQVDIRVVGKPLEGRGAPVIDSRSMREQGDPPML